MLERMSEVVCVCSVEGSYYYAGCTSGGIQVPGQVQYTIATQVTLPCSGFPSQHRVSFSYMGYFYLQGFLLSTGFPSLYRVSLSLQGFLPSTGFPFLYRVSFS